MINYYTIRRFFASVDENKRKRYPRDIIGNLQWRLILVSLNEK